jgi:glycosyltransferase involved in cell wall biosynthesis
MRALLDLQTLQSESRDRGIGRYSFGLAKSLLERPELSDSGALFNLQMPSDRLPDLGIPVGRIHYFDSLGSTRGIDTNNELSNALSEQARDAYLSARSFDLVHVSSPFDGFGDETIVSWPKLDRVALAATVYDFIPFQQPDIHLVNPVAERWYRRRLDGLQNADVILAISEYTRQVASEFLSISTDRIFNVGADVDAIFRPIEQSPAERQALLNQYGITRPFIIHTGIVEGRKNIGGLLGAFAALPVEMQKKYQVVLAGSMTPEQRRSVLSQCRTTCLDPKLVIMPGFVPDHNLARLYNLARATVMPSLSEGFGLPLLEAMRCGCPVLGSDATSIPEVVGSREFLFDPHDIGSISAKLKLMLGDDSFRRAAIEHARAQQARFSWKRSAEISAHAFGEAVALKSRRASVRGTTRFVVEVPEGLNAVHAEYESIRDVLSGGMGEVGEGNARGQANAEVSKAITIIVAQYLDEALCACLARGPAILVVLGQEEASEALDLESVYALCGWDAVANNGVSSAKLSCERLSHTCIVGLIRPAAASDRERWLVRRSRLDGWNEVQDLGGACKELWDRSAAAQLRSRIGSINGNIPASAPRSYYGKLSTVLANNHPCSFVQRLFIDVSELSKHDAKSGIQRVVRNILYELVHKTSGVRLEPVYRDAERYRYARSYTMRSLGKASNIGDSIVDFQPGDVFIGLDLDLSLSSGAAALLRRHQLRGLTVYHVVYDVLPVLRPDWFPRHLPELFDGWLNRVAEFTDGFFCISRWTATELRRQLECRTVGRNRSLRIEHFPLGADLTGDIVRAGGGISTGDNKWAHSARPTFTSVATLEPRKGHWQMLNAFEILWSRGVDVELMLVGRQGWDVEELVGRISSHREFGERLFWLSSASDALLIEVYQRSTAVLLASEGEGFGLPLVEAAMQGKPIIARDLEVFREIAGDSAFFFAGLTGEELADAVLRWIELNDLGRAPQPEAIKLTTWSDCADNLLALAQKSNVVR